METDETRVDIACKTCRFFQVEQYEDADEVSYNHDYGECRRYPPKRIDGTTSGFPYVEDEWVCGEYKPV